MEIERLGAEEGFTTPTLLRCTTSSVVYNCKSLAMPGKMVSVLLKVPTVMKGAFLWWDHGMVQHGSVGPLSREIAPYQIACL